MQKKRLKGPFLIEYSCQISHAGRRMGVELYVQRLRIELPDKTFIYGISSGKNPSSFNREEFARYDPVDFSHLTVNNSNLNFEVSVWPPTQEESLLIAMLGGENILKAASVGMFKKDAKVRKDPK